MTGVHNKPSHELVQRIKKIGLRKTLVYFLFQRILRINSEIPWPVHWSSFVNNPQHITLHDWEYYPGYMQGCYIQARNGIIIGKNVPIGPGVKIISANHNVCDFTQYDPAPPIVIGDNCWLGSNSVILPGVTLANHTIVAAGAVVTKSFTESNIVLAGVPAKIIKHIGPYQQHTH